MSENKTKSKRIEKVGVVKSDKTDKTRVVAVKTSTRHPLYGKFIKKERRFLVHDEENISREGDMVKIIKVKPMSRRKNWAVIGIMEKKEKKDGAAEVSTDGSR
jgi:small subunit ribosomal protein S17